MSEEAGCICLCPSKYNICTRKKLEKPDVDSFSQFLDRVHRAVKEFPKKIGPGYFL